MEISIYSTIDFSKARNLLTERQKKIKTFNPIVPVGGCISLMEINPKQYVTIEWFFINEKTGKVIATTADSSDGMHYVHIPTSLKLGTYRLKIKTTRQEGNEIIIENTISNPFEYVEASEDVVTIITRNSTNALSGNFPVTKKITQPIYVNPTSQSYTRLAETIYEPDYVSYLGFATAGSSEDSAVWTITKRVGSEDGTILSNVKFFNKKWTERNLL